MRHRLTGVVVAAIAAAVIGVSNANAATFSVTSTGDSGPGTLRAALLDANASAGADTIVFAIGSTYATIVPLSALPAITETVTIDGWSQGGNDYAGPPRVELVGSSAGAGADGLVLDPGAEASVVRGIGINSFSGNGITIRASGVRVQASRIGTNIGGTSAAPNGGVGISVSGGRGDNVVGTDGDGVRDAAEGNVVSGNAQGGVQIASGTANVVAGNLVGVDESGSAPVPNYGPGIDVASSSNLIGSNGDGTSDTLERNVVSGNANSPDPEYCQARRADGVHIAPGATGNRIAGNYIGTDSSGAAAVPNGCDGILSEGGGTIIGKSGLAAAPAERNVVAANRLANIHLRSSVSDVVAGNYVGTNSQGTSRLYAYGASAITYGVYLDGAERARVGTDGDGSGDVAERNIISGNLQWGVIMYGTVDSTVAGNWIGLGSDGAPVFNGSEGVLIRRHSARNVIGTDGAGAVAAERNVISANWRAAVKINMDSFDNRVAGNWIGTDATGAAAEGYANDNGVEISGVFPNYNGVARGGRNVVGTNGDGIGDAAEGNVIAGNGFPFTQAAVLVEAADDNVIAGNKIGIDAYGRRAGNVGFGVVLRDGLRNRVENNLIEYNANGGIQLVSGANGGDDFAPPIDDVISGNDIVSNGGPGVSSYDTDAGDGRADNTIERNRILRNAGHGFSNVGGSPTIRANTIRDNAGSGVYNAVLYGYPGPDDAADDVLSQPIVGGAGGANTITGNCTAGAADCAGILSRDTAPANSATIETDNIPGANFGAPFVEQRWYGTVELIRDGTPVAGAVTVTSANGGPTYTLDHSSFCPASLGGTIIHGGTGVSCSTVWTWPEITQYVVNAAGVRTTYTPQSANGKRYSFDGNASTDPTNTGAGFDGEGIQTGPYSRYQVMEAPAGAPTAVKLRGFTARR